MSLIIYIFAILVFSLSAFSCPISTDDLNSIKASAEYQQIGPVYRPTLNPEGEVDLDFFNDVADSIEIIYGPIIENMNHKLVISRQWNSSVYNLYANQNDDKMEITLLGGFAKHKDTTKASFVFLVCHELGHHLGGYPRKQKNKYWATVEGQADYYANLKCVRELLTNKKSKIKSQIELKREILPQAAIDNCNMQFRTRGEFETCLLNVQSAIEFSHSYFNYLVRSKLDSYLNGVTSVNISTPSTDYVRETSDIHPDPQCRLDTSYQASLCNSTNADNQVLSFRNERADVCHKRNGDRMGLRARCWFKGKR